MDSESLLSPLGHYRVLTVDRLHAALSLLIDRGYGDMPVTIALDDEDDLPEPGLAACPRLLCGLCRWWESAKCSFRFRSTASPLSSFDDFATLNREQAMRFASHMQSATAALRMLMQQKAERLAEQDAED